MTKPTRFWRRWHQVPEPVGRYSLGVWRECVPWWGLPFELGHLAVRDVRNALAADPWADAMVRLLAKVLLVLVGAYVALAAGAAGC